MSSSRRLSDLVGHSGSLRRQLVRGGLGGASVQMVTRLLSLLMGVVLARGLGPSGYGTYAYALAIMALLMVLTEGGVSNRLMRDIAASRGRSEWGLLRGVLKAAQRLVLSVSVLLSAIGLIVLSVWPVHLNRVTFYSTALMLLLLPFVSLLKTIAAAIRGLSRVVLSQSLELIRSALVLAAVSILFALDPTLRAPEYVMALQLSVAVIMVLLGVSLLRRSLPDRCNFAKPMWPGSDWYKGTLPFVLISGAGILNSQTDITMLGIFRASDEVGLYRVAVQGAALVLFGLQTISMVVAPEFAKLYAQGDLQRLQRLIIVSSRVAVLTALPIALAFSFGGGWILDVIFGSKFHAAYAPLLVLSLGFFLNAIFGPVGALALMVGQEKVAGHIILFTAVLNIVLNLLLIPRFGMIGAAFSTAGCAVLLHALLSIVVGKRLNLRSLPI